MTSHHLSRSLLFAALCLLASGAVSAQNVQDEKIELARTYLAQLGETQRLLSTERTDWAIEEDLLKGRIELLTKQIEALQTKLATTKESMDAAVKTTKELEGELDKVSAVKLHLGKRIGLHEKRTLALVPRLPSAITENLTSITQLIPTTKEEEEKTTLGSRYLNVIGILNRVNKFNTELHLTNEIRETAPGRSTAVNVLYVGIGQGYYVNAKGTIAGYGTADQKSWKWVKDNKAGKDILDLLDVYNNKQPARFLRLPVRLATKKGE